MEKLANTNQQVIGIELQDRLSRAGGDLVDMAAPTVVKILQKMPLDPTDQALFAIMKEATQAIADKEAAGHKFADYQEKLDLWAQGVKTKINEMIYGLT